MALTIVLFALWIVGDLMLAEWLRLDLNCTGGTRSRKSGAVEMVICSAAAGPKGWFFLIWLAAPMVALSFWLRRKLRHPPLRR